VSLFTKLYCKNQGCIIKTETRLDNWKSGKEHTKDEVLIGITKTLTSTHEPRLESIIFEELTKHGVAVPVGDRGLIVTKVLRRGVKSFAKWLDLNLDRLAQENARATKAGTIFKGHQEIHDRLAVEVAIAAGVEAMFFKVNEIPEDESIP
jgi:hypothetical protein